ncbi:MAG: PHP domain-containing protein [Chitinivibrionales bacterium]|nr:PHP domain-containing protein [Chitinivibrionales bacterium]MBD3396318.1 PHP domain-containing protein [Chitinivibrionales bacterium]
MAKTLVDFHTHSSESDGSLSPEQLVDFAAGSGLIALALCDHDTTSGLERFEARAAQKNIRVFPGVEISATWPAGNCHIVGLGVRPGYGPLEDVLRKIRDSRGNRNERIIEKLNDLGIGITLDDARALAGGDVVGRPHMARVMHQRGFVTSVQEAFDRYLAKGAPAYVDRYRLDPDKAVRLLRDARSLVVLAHPSQLQLDEPALEEFVDALVPHGLGAIEAYTPYDGGLELYLRLAKKHNLTVTGGSDFHGESKPDHRLGYYGDGLPIPVECLDAVSNSAI